MSLKHTASEVLELLDRGSYESDHKTVAIKDQFDSALAGSRLYSPDDIAQLRKTNSDGELPAIEVVNNTTQKAAQTLAAEGTVALLNFASARNPGGGFLNGAKAQEEDLCRCSGLYPTLVQHTAYYDANRAQSSMLYTDYAIYSPEVPFFRVRGTGELLAEPFLASVITAPAPNTKPYLEQSGKPELLAECFERRWCNVLAIAHDQNVSTLLLGAWGCGAFGGDAGMASETAKSAIAKLGRGLKRIVFAIPGKGKRSKHNLQAFIDQFSDAENA